MLGDTHQEQRKATSRARSRRAARCSSAWVWSTKSCRPDVAADASPLGVGLSPRWRYQRNHTIVTRSWSARLPKTVMDSIPLPLLERFLQWANVAYLVGLGVVLVTTVAIYYLSGRVTAAKDRELEEYRTESAIKISTAQAEAAEALKIAESEKLARAELESQVAAAEARAAEANAAASQAQLELATLKQPRTIAPEHQERIISALHRFAGQNFSLSVFEDPESLALVRVLDTVLKSAGWIRVPSQFGTLVVDVGGIDAGTLLNSGVAAFVAPDDDAAEPALLALSQALTDAGIPCQPTRTEQLRGRTPKAILITVGKKP